MSTLDLSTGLLFSKVQRAVAAALWRELNDELDLLDITGAEEDQAFWQEMDVAPGITVTSEHVPIERVYAGHRPSLIEAPIGFYPNVSVMVYQGVPRDRGDDEGTWYNDVLAIEVMAKAVGDDSDDQRSQADMDAQEIVNQRALRLAQAVHNVIARNETLNGLVTRIVPAPTTTVGVLFVRREEKGRGNRWYWQGVRLQYDVEKFVSFS